MAHQRFMSESLKADEMVQIRQVHSAFGLAQKVNQNLLLLQCQFCIELSSSPNSAVGKTFDTT